MMYKWNAGAPAYKVPPDIVGNAIEGIQNEYGEVTKERVLEAARPEDSPMHDLFEWNDSVAAEKFRLRQAGQILRCLIVVNDEKPDQKCRAFVRISNYNESGRFIDVNSAMQAESTRQVILRNALHELELFQQKYSIYSEFAKIFEDIEEAKNKISA